MIRSLPAAASVLFAAALAAQVVGLGFRLMF
jgi:hypothetical protein